MSDKEVDSNLGKVIMKNFGYLDFTSPIKVLKELNKMSHLIDQGYQFPIEMIEKILMKNGYYTLLDFELNEKYNDVDLFTYISFNPNLDEVGRYLIALWMQKLLDDQEISFELPLLFDFYENRVKEVEEEQKAKIRTMNR